ncbi:aspartic proteinase [Verticillium alfalfae VaMs.102]|uniref:Aspartic proteinase n=1 Tax=Verticillium alfalfae (strain VaMs.102 / ATCC MYA-4576 / FGSC 10136) TaxID=526221 RepID=C9SCH0_VERA1|nr:aspartic proteinase [Verticillium alfalfae VaMs.102]EEY16785.1 aspartic proteinase [Verticillium alfalfae VaMs.102]
MISPTLRGIIIFISSGNRVAACKTPSSHAFGPTHSFFCLPLRWRPFRFLLFAPVSRRCLPRSDFPSRGIALPFTSTPRRQVQTKTNFVADVLDYVVNVTVGNPPQEISLALDLFSYNTWVPDKEECDGNIFLSGCDYGSFDTFSSKTFIRDAVDSFDEYYASGNYVRGDDIRETISVGDTDITNLTMGLGRQTDLSLGRLALGYNASYGTPSFLDRMTEMGIINSTAFSLWTEDEDTASGSLLLGAVDASRYTGRLQRFQVYKYAMQYVGFYALVASINGSRLDTENRILQPLANLGTSRYIAVSPPTLLSNLPWDIAERIWELARAEVDYYSGQATVPCAWRDNMTGQVALELGGVGGYALTVELKDLIIPADVWPIDSNSWYLEDGEEANPLCLLGIQSQNTSSGSANDANDSDWVIGGSLLKNTYTVFDLANEELAMAPLSSGGDSQPNIVSFDFYGAVVPSSDEVGERSCWSYQPCSVVGPGSGNDWEYQSGLQDWQKIAIGASLGGTGLIIAALATWAIVRCRRVRKEEAELGKIEHPPGMLFVGPCGAPQVPAVARDEQWNVERTATAPSSCKPAARHLRGLQPCLIVLGAARDVGEAEDQQQLWRRKQTSLVRVLSESLMPPMCRGQSPQLRGSQDATNTNV